MSEEEEQQQQQKQQILQQVEFYFSDSNLLNDRFLFTTQSANDGWVPIQTISQFERMKKFRPLDLIVDALRESKDLLEVSENGEMVRRKIPLSKNYNEIQQNINKRSLFIENLPESLNLDDLMKFFTGFAPVNQVRMKFNGRKETKKFNGSCIVEFRNEDDAIKIIDTGLKYEETELKVISKTAYDQSKASKFGERRGNKGKKRNNRDNKDEEKEADRKRDASPVRETKTEDETKETKERED